MITICTNCGEPCQAVIADHGIGRYEYWGAPGNDSQLEVVSSCCDRSVVDENNNFVTVSDLETDNY